MPVPAGTHTPPLPSVINSALLCIAGVVPAWVALLIHRLVSVKHLAFRFQVTLDIYLWQALPCRPFGAITTNSCLYCFPQVHLSHFFCQLGLLRRSVLAADITPQPAILSCLGGAATASSSPRLGKLGSSHYCRYSVVLVVL